MTRADREGQFAFLSSLILVILLRPVADNCTQVEAPQFRHGDAADALKTDDVVADWVRRAVLRLRDKSLGNCMCLISFIRDGTPLSAELAGRYKAEVLKSATA